MSKLSGVGYWINDQVKLYNPEAQALHAHELELPDPRKLVEVLGAKTTDPRILEYLRCGRVYISYLGYSHCRFDCGIPDDHTGTHDLTDGTWVWPEGLVHYLDPHGVSLPQEFVDTMAGNGWKVPRPEELEGMIEEGYDLTFWKNWCAKQLASKTGV